MFKQIRRTFTRRHLALSLALLLPASAGLAQSVDYTGGWRRADESGWGLFTIDQGNVLLPTWFTYGPVILLATLDLNATYFGINVLARLPVGVTPELPNGRWIPYIGLGGGGQRLTFQAPGTNEGRDTAPAFQGLGGVKVFLTKNIAAFAEGKFIHASHSLKVEGNGSGSVDLTLNSVHGVGGLSFHF